MPELPEVETTLRGITPHILQQSITKVVIRHHKLRWPIPQEALTKLEGQIIQKVTRIAKYLLLQTTQGTLIIHLGMSGNLRILLNETPANKHDHLDITFANQRTLRFTDPRRFGAVLWTTEDPLQHPLLKNLGPEPLSRAFSGEYLWQAARQKKIAVKSFLMDNKIVVGIGNIYATESLFAAGIKPTLAAAKISLERYKQLVHAAKKILRAAIQQGGTTLKDFVGGDGKPGYFNLHLKAYGREGLPCVRCKTILVAIKLGQRTTVYCPGCQC